MRIDCPFSYSKALDQVGTDDFPDSILRPLKTIVFQLESLAREKACLDGHGGKLIAIKGDWGTGKTSVLLALEEYFRKVRGWPTIFFPAWRYHREEHPIIPLLLKLRDLASGRIKGKLTKIVRSVGVALTAGVSAVVSQVTKATLGEKVDLSTIRQIYDLIGKSTFAYYSQFETIHQQLAECVSQILEGVSSFSNTHPLEVLKPRGSAPEPHLLLVVDDLDRLFPDRALKLLENIRFFFDLERTLVVFGINDQVLTEAVNETYRGLFSGESFLEKVFVWSHELQPVHFDWNYMKSFHFGEVAENLAPIEGELTQLAAGLDALPHRKWVRIANRCENYLLTVGGSSEGEIFDVFWLALLYETFPRIESYLRSYPAVYLNPGEIQRRREELSSLAQGDETYFGDPSKNFNFLLEFFERNRPS